ncbi:Toxic component of toxin-antitoxin system, dsRBD-like fold, HicA family [Halorhabdus sp. BNX81]|nr:Toxic component of toxin-antitoxin system, dsRBD-like fold, HicA family [Halorhabdus sp. BNX81]
MSRRRFTGEDVASVLIDMDYYPVDRTGSHLKLRYQHPKTGEVRNVTVPMGGARLERCEISPISAAPRTSRHSASGSTTTGE